MKQATPAIQPLSTGKQQQVIAQTQAYIEQAVKLFNIKNRKVEINFSLKGRAAGMYRVRHHAGWRFAEPQREIRYNSLIFSKYYNDNYNTTIPHEVAHYVSDIIYGLKKIKPHGKEWQSIMQTFGANAAVTASYDLSGIALKKQRFFKYQCRCKEHQLSTIRHNRHRTNATRYYCKACKQVLVATKDTTEPDKKDIYGCSP